MHNNYHKKKLHIFLGNYGIQYAKIEIQEKEMSRKVLKVIYNLK
jgi:arsenate reductase-like glutaredoxin family protein